MKFYIKNIVIWKKDGERKVHKFLNNKINVIKGGSNTGKSSFLSVIDYCFLSSGTEIPSEINRMVEWYGIEFNINETSMFIARKSPTSKVSNTVYYSTFIPQVINKGNTTINNLKEVLNSEFSLDSDQHLAYGGPNTKRKSKLTFRPFLLFNTISQDIITSNSLYFDKLTNRQYLGTFPSAFDIASGIYPIDKLKLINERIDLNKELISVDNINKKSLEQERNWFNELQKSVNSIGFDVSKVKTIDDLGKLLKNSIPSETAHDEKLIKLRNKEYSLVEESKSINSYNKQIKHFDSNLNEFLDTSIIQNEFSRYKDSSVFVETFINLVEKETENINKERMKIKKINSDINKKRRKIKKELENVRNEIEKLERKDVSLEYSNYYEVLGKHEIINDLRKKIVVISQKEISDMENRLKDIESELEKYNSRDDVRGKINNILNEDLSKLKKNIKGYEDKDLKLSFNISKKKLEFKLYEYEEILGSESNFLIEHILLFKSLHQHFANMSSKFVLSFLIIDYLSKPYSLAIDDDKVVFKSVLNYLCDSFDTLKDFQYIVIDKVDFKSLVDKEHKSKIHNLEFDTLV